MDLTKAPKGATHWAPDKGQWCECWYRFEGDKWYVVSDYWADSIDDPHSTAAHAWCKQGSTQLLRPMTDLVEIPKMNYLVEIEGKRIIGSIKGTVVVSLNWDLAGEVGYVSSSTCLPTDLKLAATYLECYNAVFEEYANLKKFKRGDRVKVTGPGAFSAGAYGVVEFVEPGGNVWVLRDKAGSPCFFLPNELNKVEGVK